MNQAKDYKNAGYSPKTENQASKNAAKLFGNIRVKAESAVTLDGRLSIIIQVIALAANLLANVGVKEAYEALCNPRLEEDKTQESLKIF